MDSRTRPASRIDALIGLSIAILVLSALMATSGDYAMAFDEGFAVDNEMTLALWFAGVVEPPPGTRRSDFFRQRWLERNGHPVFTIRRQGVDLLRVYAFDEFGRASEATRGLPGAAGFVTEAGMEAPLNPTTTMPVARLQL